MDVTLQLSPVRQKMLLGVIEITDNDGLADLVGPQCENEPDKFKRVSITLPQDVWHQVAEEAKTISKGLEGADRKMYYEAWYFFRKA